MRRTAFTIVILVTIGIAPAAQTFDHAYGAYGGLLTRHVKGGRVDYRGLVADRGRLDAAVAAFAPVTRATERSWPAQERLAFWINAYNLLTLDAIADHYPITARFFTMQPRNSIRQIQGAWTTLTWTVAGREVTLDGIEHGIIRKEFRESLIHFAVNCASISCPPLRGGPYIASELTPQLEDSARRYLASLEGARVDGTTLRVSSIFKWYGEDFVTPRQAPGADKRTTERAVLTFLQKYGPTGVAWLAGQAHVRLAYLPYDWRLNDVGSSAE